MVVFGKSACIFAKLVVFGQKWLYSCKVVLLGQSGCTRVNWMYLGRVVVSGQK